MRILLMLSFLFLMSCEMTEDCNCPEIKEEEEQTTDSLTFETAIIGTWDLNYADVLNQPLSGVELVYDSVSLEVIGLQAFTDANLNHDETLGYTNQYEMDEENRLMIINGNEMEVGHYDADSIQITYQAPFPKGTSDFTSIKLTLTKGEPSQF